MFRNIICIMSNTIIWKNEFFCIKCKMVFKILKSFLMLYLYIFFFSFCINHIVDKGCGNTYNPKDHCRRHSRAPTYYFMGDIHLYRIFLLGEVILLYCEEPLANTCFSIDNTYIHKIFLDFKEYLKNIIKIIFILVFIFDVIIIFTSKG